MPTRRGSGLLIRTTHDCELPSMLIDTETVTYTERFWFKKETRTQTFNTYEQRAAKWSCPVCKSDWSYVGNWMNRPEYEGTWTCTRRVVEWKER